MNHYKTSTGESVSQSTIDYRITEAKRDFLENHLHEHGYYFCEECGKSSGVILDCSHDISVKKAKENRMTEQCWNIKNLTLLCRECHQEKDGLNIQTSYK